jgi:hypothetical protein
MPLRPRSPFCVPIAPGLGPGSGPGLSTGATRADLILADEADAAAYALHFEAQLRCGKMRRLRYASCARFGRAGVIRYGPDAGGC